MGVNLKTEGMLLSVEFWVLIFMSAMDDALLFFLYCVFCTTEQPRNKAGVREISHI